LEFIFKINAVNYIRNSKNYIIISAKWLIDKVGEISPGIWSFIKLIAFLIF
jgi:hypothetical protein